MKTILTFLLVLFLSGPAVAEDLPPDTLADKATKAMESGDLQKALRMVNAQMVRVEGGSFTMGCTPEQENCADDEKPTHRVQVGSFEISKYEITQELWEAVMGENPSAFGDCPQCPVETVSWDDIQAFLGKLNAGVDSIGCRAKRSGNMPRGAGSKAKGSSIREVTTGPRSLGTTRTPAIGRIR